MCTGEPSSHVRGRVRSGRLDELVAVAPHCTWAWPQLELDGHAWTRHFGVDGQAREQADTRAHVDIADQVGHRPTLGCDGHLTEGIQHPSRIGRSGGELRAVATAAAQQRVTPRHRWCIAHSCRLARRPAPPGRGRPWFRGGGGPCDRAGRRCRGPVAPTRDPRSRAAWTGCRGAAAQAGAAPRQVSLGENSDDHRFTQLTGSRFRAAERTAVRHEDRRPRDRRSCAVAEC